MFTLNLSIVEIHVCGFTPCTGNLEEKCALIPCYQKMNINTKIKMLTNLNTLPCLYSLHSLWYTSAGVVILRHSAISQKSRLGQLTRPSSANQLLLRLNGSGKMFDPITSLSFYSFKLGPRACSPEGSMTAWSFHAMKAQESN